MKRMHILLLSSLFFMMFSITPVMAASNPCNPCGMKANPCNPCGMKANPCNPCGMKKNPCGMNPCGMKKNPCGMKMNPCGMKMNPCGMKKNPCGMNPCGMKGNPCAKSANDAVDPSLITRPEGTALYKKMRRSKLVKKGKKLFNSNRLSSNGLSCNDCHSTDTLFNDSFATPYPHKVSMAKQRAGINIVNADEFVQFCMVAPMAAKPLPWEGVKLAALTAYVVDVKQKSFMKAKRANPCGMKMNPCGMNPCGMKMNPCGMKMNPCGMKMNPCGMKMNPCAMKMNPCNMKMNPCNPCAKKSSW